MEFITPEVVQSIGGVFGFFVICIVILFRMNKDNKRHDEVIDRLTLYIEKHDITHEEIEENLEKLRKEQRSTKTTLRKHSARINKIEKENIHENKK